jgi:hypothetical protein
MRPALLQLLSVTLLFIGALASFGGFAFLRTAFWSPTQAAGQLNEGPTLFGFVGAIFLLVGVVLILLGRAAWKAAERSTKDHTPP